MRKPNHEFVTVYDAKTDEILACGSREECGHVLGKDLDSFRNFLFKVKSGKSRKYTIAIENLDSGAYSVYGAENAGPRKELYA